ncbi:SRA-YDG [Dillenia turbinata]|uniref:SRA-YDG n=1 Tax=Dillenia turbinata TaxID=194707 RepID=A0AAN8VZK5_9MAGN
MNSILAGEGGNQLVLMDDDFYVSLRSNHLNVCLPPIASSNFAKILKDKGMYVNLGKPILGHVLRVEVGDEFYYRVELNIVVLHCDSQVGIDCLRQDGKLVVTCIVASGDYDGDLENVNSLPYIGQGGNITGDKEPKDQKFKKGNIALVTSYHENNYRLFAIPSPSRLKGSIVATTASFRRNGGRNRSSKLRLQKQRLVSYGRDGGCNHYDGSLQPRPSSLEKGGRSGLACHHYSGFRGWQPQPWPPPSLGSDEEVKEECGGDYNDKKMLVRVRVRVLEENKLRSNLSKFSLPCIRIMPCVKELMRILRFSSDEFV